MIKFTTSRTEAEVFRGSEINDAPFGSTVFGTEQVQLAGGLWSGSCLAQVESGAVENALVQGVECQ